MNSWLPADQDPRTDSAPDNQNPVGEKATYLDYLSFFRQTLQLKCEGLTPEQLATRSVPPSTLSLLGLVRHMAYVEHNWFVRVGRGADEEPLYFDAADNDFEFTGAVGTSECVDEAFTSLSTQIASAEEWLDGVDESDFGRELALPRGGVASIRDILVHMIEEYARHCGHADLLRECIDGRTGT